MEGRGGGCGVGRIILRPSPAARSAAVIIHYAAALYELYSIQEAGVNKKAAAKCRVGQQNDTNCAKIIGNKQKM